MNHYRNDYLQLQQDDGNEDEDEEEDDSEEAVVADDLFNNPYSIITNTPINLDLDCEIAIKKETQDMKSCKKNLYFNMNNSIDNIDISKHSINNFIGQFNQNDNARIQRDQQIKCHFKLNKSDAFQCPICLTAQRKLFCSSCIKNGDFTHSKNNFLERFADKKLKFIKLKGEQLSISDFLKNHHKNSAVHSRLNSKIEITQRSITFMQMLAKQKNSILQELKLKKRELILKRLNCEKKQEKLRYVIMKVKKEIDQHNVNIKNYSNESTDQKNLMKSLMQDKIKLISTYIYPIIMVISNESDNEDNNENFSESSEDAPLMINSDEQNKQLPMEKLSPIGHLGKFKILDCLINLEDNYGIGTFIKLQNYRSKELDILCDQNRLMAAFFYLCNLINLIAAVCRIMLPVRTNPMDFLCPKMCKFLRNVANLNMNIIFLSLFFGINTNQFNPKCSFKNMKYLLDQMDLVKNLRFHFEIDENVLEQLNNTFVEATICHDVIIKNEESEYDMVEDSVPDLNLQNAQQSSITSFLSSFLPTSNKTCTNKKI